MRIYRHSITAFYSLSIILARVCSQSHRPAKLCKPEQCSRQMNESEESASELFEAHSDSAMIFDLHQKAFNKMPFLVVTKIGVSSCHICAPRDYHFVIILYTICAIFARCYSIPFKRLSLETHSNIVWAGIFIVCFELAHLFLNIPRETEQCDRTE